MDKLNVGALFCSLSALLAVKCEYENASKTVLVKSDSLLLKGDKDLIERFKYSRIRKKTDTVWAYYCT